MQPRAPRAALHHGAHRQGVISKAEFSFCNQHSVDTTTSKTHVFFRSGSSSLVIYWRRCSGCFHRHHDARGWHGIRLGHVVLAISLAARAIWHHPRNCRCVMISYWDGGGSRTLWRLPDGCSPGCLERCSGASPLLTHPVLICHVANQINCTSTHIRVFKQFGKVKS